MIKETFSKNKSLFIPFIMAGYPNREISIQATMALAEVGSDIIELGVPFSDPIADGSVNQNAATTAIAEGMNLQKVMVQVQTVRELGCLTPIILFSYFNPILNFGIEEFCKQAKTLGVNGLLIVDLPPEEGAFFYQTSRQAGLEIVLLASPTTALKRLSFYKTFDPSFIYYVSRLGVTGMQKDLSETLKDEVVALREKLQDTKISVGFGISSVAQAKSVSAFADGVIIGSQLVHTLGTEGLASFKVRAMDFARSIHG